MLLYYWAVLPPETLLCCYNIVGYHIFPVSSSMSEADRTKMAVGASGLVLGLVLALCGVCYYQRKKQGDQLT